MLNLFDSYSRESQDLLHSLQEAGYQQPTVVLEPNGFLPDGVESPFIYFLGKPSSKMARKRRGFITMRSLINGLSNEWNG